MTLAVSFPIPVFPPVTIITLPAKSGTSSTLQGFDKPGRSGKNKDGNKYLNVGFGGNNKLQVVPIECGNM